MTAAAPTVRVREATALTRRTVTILLNATNDDALPVPGQPGRQFRPARINVYWIRRDETPWRLESASIHGQVLKKDGTDSVLTAKRVVGSSGISGRPVAWQDDCPPWARDAVERYAPAGDGPR